MQRQLIPLAAGAAAIATIVSIGYSAPPSAPPKAR
jgi:hypothetical protein